MSFLTDYQREAKRNGERGRCLHFADGNRCNEIISAHSIQKRGQLSLIAEDGHVYRFSADLSMLKTTGGVPRPKKTGLQRTSTFAGFCKHHDNALFKPIDNQALQPNSLQVALYAYRSICRELFVKENAVRLLENMKCHPDLDEKGRSFLKSSYLGHSLGLAGIEHHKNYYDEALLNGRYEEFEYTCFTTQEECPVQLSGNMYPDYGFDGRKLQDLGNWSSPVALISFFTAPTSDGWAFCFAWHASSNYVCVPFMQSLASSVAEGKKLEDALLRFSFACCENHAFRISWWDSLPVLAKRHIVEKMVLLLSPNMPIPPNYLSDGCEGLANWSFEHVYTTLTVDA